MPPSVVAPSVVAPSVVAPPVVPPPVRTAPLALPPPPLPPRSVTSSLQATRGEDGAVRCSCHSPSDCPEIATLTIGGYKPLPVYCNQLNGSENPGVRRRDAWTFQCVELANRWLVESVGAPRIGGDAKQMCSYASRASFDVHYRGTTYEPEPGDLLVWDGATTGHVGIVRSVSSSSIVLVNQNYGDHGVQYPVLTVPRTEGSFGSPRGDGGLHAKCIIHPKTSRPAR